MKRISLIQTREQQTSVIPFPLSYCLYARKSSEANESQALSIDLQIKKVNIKNYMKYILHEGAIYKKRELLSSLKSKLILKDKKIYLEK